MQTTLKEIKEFNAIDITYYKEKQIMELLSKEKTFKIVTYSKGLYGTTGVVAQGYTTKELYKIQSRTSALFMII